MEVVAFIFASSILLPPTPPLPRHSRRRRNRNSFLSKATRLSPSPKSSAAGTDSFRPPPLTTIISNHSSDLKYYADLASRLMGDGRIDDFLLISESVFTQNLDTVEFVSLLDVELLCAGIARVICCPEKICSIVEMLSSIEKHGISPSVLFDGLRKESLARECRKLVDYGNVQEAVQLMEILFGFGISVKQLVKPLCIIKSCVDKRDPDMAIRYAYILPRTHVVLCTIIQEFGNNKDLLSAMKAFEASKKYSSLPNMYAYRVIIDVCGLCGNYIRSRHIYEELLAQNFTPNVFVINSLMNANAHDLRYALRLYRQMKSVGVTPDVASYNILLKSCCLSGRVDLAQKIYHEVRELACVGAFRLDVFTYSTIIKVLADAKLWHVALAIKKDMISAGVTPNIIIWSSLISACANAGLVEKAIQLFNEMILSGVEPNSQCFNILLHACVEAYQYDRAFRFFLSWKTDGLYYSKGNGDHSIMNNNTVPISYNPRSGKKFTFIPTTSTYNTLMKACGSDYHRASSLMYEMKTMGLPPDHVTWSILINICRKTGNVENAILILRSMQESGINPDVVAYTAAIKVCVENKKLNQAFSLYEKMRSSHVQPNLVTYSTFLRAHSRYGSMREVQQCLAIYHDMRKAGYHNDYFLNELIEEWCEGVIQGSVEDQSQDKDRRVTETETSESLIQKVGVHLQKSISESLVIDIRGLTQIEARIIVLVALRMFKENFILGKALDDDMIIIIGNMELSGCARLIKDAIIRVLRNELGLEVVKAKIQDKDDCNMNTECTGNSKDDDSPIKDSEFCSPRRPTHLERIIVTNKSLCDWATRNTNRPT